MNEAKAEFLGKLYDLGFLSRIAYIEALESLNTDFKLLPAEDDGVPDNARVVTIRVEPDGTHRIVSDTGNNE